MRFSLRKKLLTLTFAIVASLLVTVTYLVTIRDIQARRVSVESQMENLARSVATLQLLDKRDWSVYQNYIEQLLASNRDIVFIAIYDDQDQLRAHALNVALLDIGGVSLSKRDEQEVIGTIVAGGVSRESEADLRSQQVDILLGQRVLGRVHVGFSLIAINNELRREIRQNVLVGLGFMALAGVLSFVLSRRLTRPLERLSGAMSALARGDLEQRVEVGTHDEIAALADSFNSMVRDLGEREIIDRLGRELSSTFRLDRLANLVRARLGSAVGASEARLFLCQHSGDQVLCQVAEDGLTSERDALRVDDAASRLFLDQADDGFLAGESPLALVETLRRADIGARDLVTPMQAKGELFGLIVFRPGDSAPPFDQKQRHFAATLANQAALALENARLYEELSEQQRLQQELAIARRVQQRLLPQQMPQLEGFEIDAACYPAYEVGGDYYDFFDLGEGRIGIAIADVSGKGTSASFYMAELKGMMLTLAGKHTMPAELLRELNRGLYASFERSVFATMIYGILEAKERSFLFARAGHNAAFHLDGSGGCRRLAPRGIGLGLEGGEVFDRTVVEERVEVRPGETLLLYTDGFTDAMDLSHELFGERRLVAAARSANSTGAKAVHGALVEAVTGFAGAVAASDDSTLVVIHGA